jgi:hypothetical protein
MRCERPSFDGRALPVRTSGGQATADREVLFRVLSCVVLSSSATKQLQTLNLPPDGSATCLGLAENAVLLVMATCDSRFILLTSDKLPREKNISDIFDPLRISYTP